MWAEVASRIEAHTGMAFAENRMDALKRGVRAMARALRFDSTGACLAWLAADPWDWRKTQACGIHLTVSETYFFREPAAFEVVAAYLRQRWATRPDERARLWSAACCTGEEAYSLAITARREAAELPVSILATDINPDAIATACKGWYRRWAFRGVPEAIRQQYFDSVDRQQFRIKPAIRERVRFDVLNLAEANYPSSQNQTERMDIILLRNLLIYLSPDKARHILGRLRDCLVEEGLLIVGQSELSQALFAGFEEVRFGDFVFYRKSRGPRSLAVPPRCAEVPAVALAGGGQHQPGLGAATPPAPVAPLETAHRRTLPRVNQTAEVTRATQPTVVRARRRSASEDAPSEPVVGNPSSARARLEKRLNRLIRDGRRADAVVVLEAALAREPLDPGLHFLNANLCLEAGDTEAAMASLRKVLYLDPDAPAANYLLGVLQVQKGESGSGKKQLEQFLSALSEREATASAAVKPGTAGTGTAGGTETADPGDMDLGHVSEVSPRLMLESIRGLWSEPEGSE